jgi:hypothetical protein
MITLVFSTLLVLYILHRARKECHRYKSLWEQSQLERDRCVALYHTLASAGDDTYNAMLATVHAQATQCNESIALANEVANSAVARETRAKAALERVLLANGATSQSIALVMNSIDGAVAGDLESL